MARHHSNDKVSKKIKIKSKLPQVYVDRDADFASIKISPGIEAKSYEQDGFVFCEVQLSCQKNMNQNLGIIEDDGFRIASIERSIVEQD